MIVQMRTQRIHNIPRNDDNETMETLSHFRILPNVIRHERAAKNLKTEFFFFFFDKEKQSIIGHSASTTAMDQAGPRRIRPSTTTFSCPETRRVRKRNERS